MQGGEGTEGLFIYFRYLCNPTEPKSMQGSEAIRIVVGQVALALTLIPVDSCAWLPRSHLYYTPR